LLQIPFQNVMYWNKMDNVTPHYPFINSNRGNVSPIEARGGMQNKYNSSLQPSNL
jgi:hypothetical protein